MGGINHKKWHGLQLFYPRHLFFVNAFCEGFTCTISDKELLWVWVSSWSLVGWSLYQQIVLLQVQNFQAQMMLRIDIALPSGKMETPWSSRVLHSRRFQNSGPEVFPTRLPETHYCRKPCPHWQNLCMRPGFVNGDQLTAVALQANLAASNGAFALWCSGGDSIVTWGKADHGGDSSAVQSQLNNVQQVVATHSAFATILDSGAVVAWGASECGGNSSIVQDRLQNVQQIQATARCHAGRWICCCMGWSEGWWGQLWRPRSSECAAGPECRGWCVCCHPGRWIRGDMGLSLLRWWLLCNPRSAQECAAGSGHTFLQSWKTDQWLLGAIQILVGIAQQSKISWRASGSLQGPSLHLLLSSQIDQLLRGAIHVLVVTPPQSKISSRMCRKCIPHQLRLLRSLQMALLWGGNPRFGGDSSAVQSQLRNV